MWSLIAFVQSGKIFKMRFETIFIPVLRTINT